jgi:hypothetical protein
LREHWDNFKKIASGESPKTDLPTWNKYKPDGGDKKNALNDIDDDIPF